MFATVEIQAEGASLSVRFYPRQRAAKAHLRLHRAAGVPPRYYAAFANWASEQGLGVLTYDYRDFGESQHRPLHQSDANFADWVIRDQAAAEARLAALAPEGPLRLLGHSLGGLGFAFREYDPRVERITTFGAGFCHVSDQPWSMFPIALAFFYVVGPVGTALAGYFPGRKLLLGADLPAGVYWQWRKWATRRDFFQSDIGKSLPEPNFQIEGPALQMLTTVDDVVIPPVAVRRSAAFPEGRVTYRVLYPGEFGLRSLRHIKVFSPRNAAAWPAILESAPSTRNSVEDECRSVASRVEAE
jgi:predicted alpha/beta hydrolase